MKKLYASAALAFMLSATFLSAQSNQYLHFDKIDDYVEVPNASQYIANSNAISMAGWFYTDALTYGQGMMGFRGGGTGNGEMYLIQLDNGTLECRFINTAGFFEYVAPAFTILPQVWQHVAWVYTGTQVQLFIDGELKGSAPANGVIASTNRPFAIGKSVFSTFNFVYGGRVDEVTLWNKALTATDLQDMMQNELTGNEPGLQLYYKFNQGVPGEDNTSITKLISEVEPGPRDGNLLNFALTGNTSNFGGTLNNSFQAITFPQIPNKLVSDPPFELNASASSGLPVSYEVASGPATINGNTVTLDGTPGQVTIKASQPGNGTFDAAVDILNTFQVLDPATFVPVTEARSPLAGDVMVPNLGPIQLAAISSIAYPELFSVSSVKFEINGEEIEAKDWGNNHYTGWWTPPAYGAYTMNIIATHNFGASSTETVNFTVVDQASDMNVNAGDEVWLSVNIPTEVVEIELPCYAGAFDQIIATLDITCPTGGCDPWDRVSGIEVKGHDGEWYEIIRYITPYGVACGHSIDLTDFMSLLQGKIAFRFYLGTQGNGFEYTLNLQYKAGEPQYPYSSVRKLWYDTYPFGDPANKLPCEEFNIAFPDNSNAAKIKLVSTGHGWGNNNFQNAAEFYQTTHHIHIDGAQTFAQLNWNVCNPNPDGCQPQNGTWFHNRAGWCPGAIAPWFNFDMTPFIGSGMVEYKYIFNQGYTDFCHPNNAGCISGITCPDCNDGFNPHLIVSSYLINLSDTPLAGISSVNDLKTPELAFRVFPNPSTGVLNLSWDEALDEAVIQVVNNLGQVVHTRVLNAPTNATTLELQGLAKGFYYVQVSGKKGSGVRKVLIE
jgi:hypothetical protein